jgi:hypothetical protein
MIPYEDREWTLKEIRKALASLDNERFVKRSSYEEVALLENSIHDLRDAERALIAQNEEELINKLKLAAQSLAEHSRNIRANVAKMNRTAKVMDGIEKVVKRVVDVIQEFNRWH